MFQNDACTSTSQQIDDKIKPADRQTDAFFFQKIENTKKKIQDGVKIRRKALFWFSRNDRNPEYPDSSCGLDYWIGS